MEAVVSHFGCPASTAAAGSLSLLLLATAPAGCGDDAEPLSTPTGQGASWSGGAGGHGGGEGAAGALPAGDARILYLDVPSAPEGEFVGIYGSGFGASRGSSRVLFGAVEAASYVSWGPATRGAAPSEIIVTVPSGAGSPISVETASGPSNEVAFATHAGRRLWVAPNGDDDGDCTSEVAPCATPRGAKERAAAGDVIVIREGVYDGCDGSCPNPVLYLRESDPSGTPAHPITFRGFPGESVTLDASGTGQTGIYSHGSHLRFVNLRATGKNGMNAASGVDVRFANCEVFESNRCGIDNGCGGTDWADWFSAGSGLHAGETSEEVTFVGNDIHDNGIERRDHGLYVYGQDMRIAFNRIWQNFGYGVHGYHGGGPDFFGMQVYGNLVWANGPPGQVQSGTAGILCHESCHQAAIFDNVVWQNFSRGIVAADSASTVRIFNNTLFDNDGHQLMVGGAASDVVIRNNIFVDRQGPAEHLRKEDTTNGVVADHNLFFPDDADAFRWDGMTFDFAGYLAASGQGDQSLTADPRLADLDAVDIHLQDGSPAIDGGTGVIAEGVAAPRTDFEADPRPLGAGVDIGADEYRP